MVGWAPILQPPEPTGHNTLNYTEQGGETTHIGGKLVIDEGGSVEGLPSPSPSPLTLPVVIAETDENGYFGYTFRELWEMYNQNKLIFIFRKDSAESSVPDATDYKTRLFMVFRMEYTGGINYYLTLLACSEDSQAIMSPCIGSANASPCIH